MDASVGSDRTEKPWDYPWTTDEMRKKRTDWNLAGDSGLLQHLHQFSDKLMTTANKTQEALNSLSSELDQTIILIDNITNTSLALANTQFIESRVCEDDVETEPNKEEQPEISKTKEQLDAELIASIGDSVRRGIAIMDEKYETVELIASDSEDEEDVQIPSIILRLKDPYQDRLLPYVIGSDKWEKSNKIGLESSSSSESEHQEEDDSEKDHSDDITAASKPNNPRNQRISRLSVSLSEPNDHDIPNNIAKHAEDKASNQNEDIFDSENDDITAANSLPKNSNSAVPNFAEELAKRLGSVIPTDKSINTQIIGEPIANQSEDPCMPEDEEDLFGTPSKNLFNDVSPNPLWRDKPAKSFESSIIPPSFEGPPPIVDVPSKSKSSIDDLFGDADSEDSDDIFSGKTSMAKSSKQKRSSTNNLRVEANKRTNKLLSVDGVVGKEGMATSTPETNDVAGSLFDNDSEDMGDLFGENKKKNKDWTEAKASAPDKTVGSTLAEASDTSHRKKPVGGVSILGNIDIFSSGKLRHQISSDSSSSKSSADFDTSQSRITDARDDTVPPLSENTTGRSSVMAAAGNTESQESSGVFLQPPSIDDVTTGSNISPNFQPQMTSTWNKTGDMYRENIVGDSLFAAKTLPTSPEALNNARIDEAPEIQNREPFDDPEDIFGPPPLPKAGSKREAKSKLPSLFDDSDSGDDFFSRTSSGSHSQKNVDFLSTASTSLLQSSEKSKIIRTKGLFDDDDDEDKEEEEGKDNGQAGEETSDIFGGKDSAFSDVNLFEKKEATTNERFSVRETASSESNKTSKMVAGRENIEKEKNTMKFSQAPSAATKLESIFDDLDDDDLFRPSLSKQTSKLGQKNAAPSLFDDGSDDLFASPQNTAAVMEVRKSDSAPSKTKTQDSTESLTRSATKVGDRVKSKVMEQLAAKLEVAKTAERGTRDAAKDELGKKKEAVKCIEDKTVAVDRDNDGDISANDKPKDLAAKILVGLKAAQKSKADEATVASKPGVAKKPDALKKFESVSTKPLHVRREFTASSLNTREEISIFSEEEESTANNFESSSAIREQRTESLTARQKASLRSEESEESEESTIGGKREPPNTLEIHSSTVTTTSSTSTSTSSEGSNGVQRRVVSGKIKNLMGRMNDLKILSPTDSPPVWRKNDERVGDERGKDNQDGANHSSEVTKSPALPEEPEKPVAPPLAPPTPPEEKHLEPAISFDEPVQVRTLSVTTSKSRARIQTKRRPQSRQARQIALRKSGIDFDTVDAVDFSNENNLDGAENSTIEKTERLMVSTAASESLSVKVTESSSSTFLDDRSEVSFSKESTITTSVNKNTLLSPSTDEEDLFDVPPDLPEDPPKEDALFGRAPILSPVESFVGASSRNVKQETRKSEKQSSASKEKIGASSNKDAMVTKVITVSEESAGEAKRPYVDEKIGRERSREEVTDPLRDGNHDPLKDPSTLFPFVTKTPSPEKGKNLLFNDDADSLFTSKSKEGNKGGDNLLSGGKKQSLDLFADDTEADFFSTSLSKQARKTNREESIDLFANNDNQEEEDELFGGSRLKKSVIGGNVSLGTKSSTMRESLFAKAESEEQLFGSPRTVTEKKRAPPSSHGLFCDSESSEIFTAGTAKSSEVSANSGTKTNVDNIFGDQSSGDEDMFVGRKSTLIKKQTTSSTGLFDDDAGDLFGSSNSSLVVKSESTESRKVFKKTATRDLRKTAETIVEDPLSMLQKD